MGFVEEVKGIFNEKLFTGFGYAVVSGLASGTVGAILQRYGKSKWAAWLGYIIGSAGMAYVAERFLKHPEWKEFAYFGGLFPPLWEAVTDRISPDQIANKVSASLGLPWYQAVTTTYTAPAKQVTLTVSPQPTQPVSAEEEFNF